MGSDVVVRWLVQNSGSFMRGDATLPNSMHFTRQTCRLTSLWTSYPNTSAPCCEIQRIDSSYLPRHIQGHHPRRALSQSGSIASSAKTSNTGNLQCDFLHGHQYSETCSTLTEKFCLILRALADRPCYVCDAHIGRNNML